MNSIKWKIVTFTKSLQPSVGCVRVLRLSVVANKKAVGVRPMVAEFGAFLRLLDLQLTEYVHDLLRELQSPLGASGLGDVGINSFADGVTGSSADADDVVLPIYVLPLQTEEFPAPVTAEYRQLEKGLVLQRFFLKHFKETCDLLRRVDLLFLLLHLGDRHLAARIFRDRTHFNTVCENVRDETQVMLYGFRSKPLAVDFVCAVLGEAVHEHLYLTRSYLVHSQMPYSLYTRRRSWHRRSYVVLRRFGFAYSASQSSQDVSNFTALD